MPNTDNYKFHIPFYVTNDQHSKIIKENVNFLNACLHIALTSQIPDDTIPWVETYNLIPNMFIPVKYCDIIPKDPIYIFTTEGEIYIPPGSREWFTYMYNLERRIRRQQRFDEIAPEATYHGTTFKHLCSRLHHQECLTHIQNTYDEYIRHHIANKNHPDHINNDRKQKNLNRNLNKILSNLKKVAPDTHYGISDDTKAIER
ncbi:hypothetical protein GLOIN_2v1772862 [Rhizophagus irregularis DAOM 181602=DAOM 197198]|uniref:Uncharacterized protein n=2 Tax=Rhizophagus irregularis TaxID=588596 RepID=A0A2P4Q657_RHIID|nr:hypothetical protein GLOIN_2v1772862 [Rhizophagus irregularis DAOM 181602=DAOM 197198]POG73104.1 hypothetical protein GLOIN_2v1772862 [Rhizophagus irregularis DAOM 181602=DAOM 197198]CAG8630293.1 11670_t:CDS:2 [Rhizophagus irregularis]|eukprot:XP_025179970.1 hypothetical protein GLOIN_2v1772862 [Rhizophagus irregularis DAOM 181602=DAOM 197198]